MCEIFYTNPLSLFYITVKLKRLGVEAAVSSTSSWYFLGMERLNFDGRKSSEVMTFDV